MLCVSGRMAVRGLALLCLLASSAEALLSGIAPPPHPLLGPPHPLHHLLSSPYSSPLPALTAEAAADWSHPAVGVPQGRSVPPHPAPLLAGAGTASHQLTPQAGPVKRGTVSSLPPLLPPPPVLEANASFGYQFDVRLVRTESLLVWRQVS